MAMWLGKLLRRWRNEQNSQGRFSWRSDFDAHTLPMRHRVVTSISTSRRKLWGHPVNGEVERGSALSGSQIWFPVRLSI